MAPLKAAADCSDSVKNRLNSGDLLVVTSLSNASSPDSVGFARNTSALPVAIGDTDASLILLISA